jgi:thiamine monophosphate kinase
LIAERFAVALTDVGEITDGDRIVAAGEAGRETIIQPKGWDHFAAR